MYLLPVFGQYTFHKLVYLEFPMIRFTGVFPTDSCFYISGTFTDTISPLRTGTFLSKMDLQGELANISTIKHPDRLYFNDFADLKVNNEGNLYTVGIVNDTAGSVKGILYIYDLEGDTISTFDFRSPLYPDENHIWAKEVLQKSNGNYVIANNHWALNPNSNDDNDLTLLSVTSDFQTIFFKTFGTKIWDEYATSLILDDEGQIFGAKRSNEAEVFLNFNCRTLLIKTDSLGNQQWQWLSPEGVLQDGAHAMIKTPDGGLVVASGQGQEIGNNPNIHTLVWDALIFKLDADRNVVWSTPFRGGLPTGQTKLTEMVEATDCNGYVASGIFLEYISDVEWYHTSWLVKVSPEGDSLWARRYTYFDGEFVAPEVYDMKATPDGGYVLVGLSRNVGLPAPAWIMKVDSFGCLIPGCQLDDTTAVSGSPEQTARLAIFPNPASDFLHFELRPASITSTFTARILDANGKTITEIPAVSAHTTYTLPLWHWPPGVYFLQLLHDGVPVRTERFVVGR